MKPKRKVEEAVREKLRFTAGSTFRDRLWTDVANTHEKSTKISPIFHESGLRRKLMKSPIVKLTSVAAVLAVATTSILFLSKFSQPAYALDQTVEALQKIRFVHLIQRNDTGVIEKERWIEVGEDGVQVRYRQDKPPYLFVIDDGKSVARYHPYAKTVTRRDRGEMRYEWISNIGQAFENARDEGMILEENAGYHGRRAHKVWWPAMREVCYVDPVTKLPIAIGNTELSYEQPPAETFVIAIPDSYSTANDVNESGFSARVELIQPDKRLAEIVNANDVIRLHRTGPYTYEGDLDIQVACSTDIRWGLSMRTNPPKGFHGCLSCSVDRFDMAKPGGVATVGVKITEGEFTEEPQDGSENSRPVWRPPTAQTGSATQDGNIGVVTLQVEPRPAPMDDARTLEMLGLAFYDAGRYEEALAMFQRQEKCNNADQDDRAMAVIWQGHMLDLLGEREEAIARYRRVADMGLDSGIRHDQYGLAYEYTPYAKERMITPFVRVENRQQD
jgi:hypothetical protein